MFWCNWSRSTMLLPCCTSSTSIKDHVVDPQDHPPPDHIQRRDALSTSSIPTRPIEYYFHQCDLYFDSIQSSSFTPRSHRHHFPRYSKYVTRWEWSPWLMLTSIGRNNLITIDKLIRMYPCVCVDRQYRYSPIQPFVRCQVTLYYGLEVQIRQVGLHIYEEFTFNDLGEMTFIEAWLCEEGLQLGSLDDDGWPLNPDEIQRLSTLLPGLGSPTGAMNMKSSAFQQACQEHPEVEDFHNRVNNFYSSLMKELIQDLMSKKENFLGFPSKKKSASAKLRSRSDSTDTTAGSTFAPQATPYPFNGHILQRVPFSDQEKKDDEEEKYDPFPQTRTKQVKSQPEEEEWKDDELDPDLRHLSHIASGFHNKRDSRELYHGSDFQEVPSEDWLEWEGNKPTRKYFNIREQHVKPIGSPDKLYSEGENII